jgi:hypothetical protein
MIFTRLLPFLTLLQSYVQGQFGSLASKWENPTQPTTRPNIIFLLTDDQDLHLDSLNYLPLVKKHLTDQGTFYSKHYCTIAICCPARVTLWTGKAAHNTVRKFIFFGKGVKTGFLIYDRMSPTLAHLMVGDTFGLATRMSFLLNSL